MKSSFVICFGHALLRFVVSVYFRVKTDALRNKLFTGTEQKA